MSYFEEAKKRAKERLESPWTILLRIFSFLLIGVIWFLLAYGIWQIHLLWFPTHIFEKDMEGILAILMVVPPLIAAIPLSLLFSNYLIFQFSSARKSLDKVANYDISQKKLLKLTPWVVIPSLLISLIAAVI